MSLERAPEEGLPLALWVGGVEFPIDDGRAWIVLVGGKKKRRKTHTRFLSNGRLMVVPSHKIDCWASQPVRPVRPKAA